MPRLAWCLSLALPWLVLACERPGAPTQVAAALAPAPWPPREGPEVDPEPPRAPVDPRPAPALTVECLATPAAVVTALARALERRDLGALARLRGEAPDDAARLRAERLFFAEGGEALWGRALGALDPAALAAADVRAAAGATRVELRAELGGGAFALVLVATEQGWRLP